MADKSLELKDELFVGRRGKGKPVAPTEVISAKSILCADDRSHKAIDDIETWHPVGAPDEEFPEVYKKVQKILRSKHNPLMDQGVRFVAISGHGDAKKGGSMTIMPMWGNTWPVTLILNQIRGELNAAGVKADRDPEYMCPNMGGESRAVRITIPAQPAMTR